MPEDPSASAVLDEAVAPVAQSEKKTTETVRDLFSDPTFENAPLDTKLERFQKAAKTDFAYQKMSNDGKKFAHQKLFASEFKENEALTKESPGPPAPEVTAESHPRGKYGASLDAADREREQERQAAAAAPPPPEEPTSPDVGLWGSIGHGVVKGIEQPAQLAHLVTEAGVGVSEALGGPTPSPEMAARSKAAATPIQSYVTGPLLSSDVPGYRTVEHVVENVVGTALMTPVMRFLIPTLAKGTTLTKDIIQQAIHSGIAAVPGQVVKDANMGAGAQIVTEMSATAITGTAQKLLTSLKNRPALIEAFQDALQQQDPTIIANIEKGMAAEKTIPGYKATLPEFVPESDIAAGTARQLSLDKPVEFGIPYVQKLKNNVQAAINHVTSLFGSSSEKVIGQGLETARAPIVEAEKHHAFLKGIAADKETELRHLNDTGRQAIHNAEDTHYATITQAETDIRAAQDDAASARLRADKLVRDAKQQGVELDSKLLKEARDAEADALRRKQLAQDTHTKALQDSQDLHQGVIGETRTDAQAAQADVTKWQDTADEAKQAASKLIADAKQRGVEVDAQLLQKYRDLEDRSTKLGQDARDKHTSAVQAADAAQQEKAGAARTSSQKADVLVGQWEDEIAHTHAQAEKDMNTMLEHHRKTFGAGAVGDDKGYRAGIEKAAQAARDMYNNSLDRLFGIPATKDTPAVPGIFEKAYKKLYADHGITGDNEFKLEFVDKIRAGGTFEEKLVTRLQGRYEPDPIMYDIRESMAQKAKKAGLDDDGSFSAWLHNSGDDAVRPEVIGVPINLDDVSGYRTQVLQELRSTPADSPRRRVLNELLSTISDGIDDMARTEADKKVLGKLRKINGSYRTETLRHFGDDTPGELATVTNPRTGEPMYPLDYVGKNLFGPAPIDGRSLTDARHVEMFGQYMDDLDHAIERGRYEGIADARRAKNDILQHVKNEFYRSYFDQTTGKFTPDKAEKWISSHQPLLDKNAELKQIFGTDSDQLSVIREMQARFQYDELQLTGGLENAQRAQKSTATAGSEIVYQSRREQAEAKRTAGAVQTAEERALQESTTREKRGFENEQIAQEALEREAAATPRAGEQELAAAQRQKRNVSAAGEERVYKSKREQVEAQREAALAATTEEREASSKLTRQKQAFEDIAAQQNDRERLLGLVQKDENVAAAQQVTNAERAAETAKREAGREVVTTKRDIEQLKLDKKEEIRLAQEKVTTQEAHVKAVVNEWKQNFGGAGPFTDPLNQDIAAQKFGAQSKDLVKRIEEIPNGKDRGIAYNRLFAASKDDPALVHSVVASMWENFLEKFNVAKLDPKKEPKMIAEFLAKNKAILSDNLPQYAKDLDVVQEVLTNIDKAMGASTAGVPQNLKSLTRGQIRTNDWAAMATAKMAGFGYATVGQVGLATEVLLRMSKEGRARVLKEIILNPNATRLISQIENPNVQRSWKMSAIATLLFNSGGKAAELNEEP